jgi:hypothetical protein
MGMGVKYHWHEPSILVITVKAPWTWEEYMRVAEDAFSEMAQYEGKLATIVDIREMGGLPQGSMLNQLREISRILPENIDISVMVGAPAIVNAFMGVFMRLNPRAQRIATFTATLEEAFTLIQQRRTG